MAAVCDEASIWLSEQQKDVMVEPLDCHYVLGRSFGLRASWDIDMFRSSSGANGSPKERARRSYKGSSLGVRCFGTGFTAEEFSFSASKSFQAAPDSVLQEVWFKLTPQPQLSQCSLPCFCRKRRAYEGTGFISEEFHSCIVNIQGCTLWFCSAKRGLVQISGLTSAAQCNGLCLC